MNKNALTLENVTKEYKVFSSPSSRLLYSLTRMQRFAPQIFTAVNDVSFSVPKGEILGIIGRNGAGKSTILKLVTGVSYPTTGTVEVGGRIASLLELGAGFNPELSGRDNIFFQGEMMGFTKAEMEAKIPSILEFADIGDFIEQPVKNYSSGMFARLAFATASHVEPDILIVDEVLAVGDIAFQFKCIERMKEFARQGVTILFVTHSMMSLYRFCDRAIWINEGRVILDGTVEDVVPRYEDFVKTAGNKSNVKLEDTSGSYIRMHKYYLEQQGKVVEELEKKIPFVLNIEYELLHDLTEDPYFAISIAKEGIQYDIFGVYPAQDRYTLPKSKGVHTVEIAFTSSPLNVGAYDVYFSISEQNGVSQLYMNQIGEISVVGNYDSLGLVDIEHHVTIK